jgi:hypothetical protein
LKPSNRINRLLLSENLNRFSTNVATSEVDVPRNADLLITTPLTTGRSLLMPSPLLSTPVVALNGREDANIDTVPAVMSNGKR